MTTRILPPEEWHRLDGEKMKLPAIEKASVDGDVIVVEDDGVIVGCWSVMTCVHVEGLWIDPRYRRQVSVGRRLWKAMRSVVARRGAKGALMCSVSESSRQMIERDLDNVEVLGRHYAVTV